MVCRKDEPGDALFIVVTGKFKVTAQSEDGKELILAILEDGETFSEMSLLDGQPRSANVTAVHDSQLLVIKRQDFLAYLEQHPKVSIALLVILSARLREMDSMMGGLCFLDVHGRLAIQHGRATGSGSIRIDLKLRQEYLDNLICATRESVNKQLKTWEGEGGSSCVRAAPPSTTCPRCRRSQRARKRCELVPSAARQNFLQSLQRAVCLTATFNSLMNGDSS